MNKKWFAILLAITVIGCKKEGLTSNLPVINDLGTSVAATAPVAVTLTVDQTKTIYNIPPNFEGLSFETGVLVENPDFLNADNAVLIQLIKNLGKGVLRIGGNSSDEINWFNGPRTTTTPLGSLATTDVDQLTAFSKAIQWPVLFGLNLANNNAADAAKEALYVTNSLQGNLIALQSGNEPDVFNLKPRPSTYNYTGYQHDWDTYFSAIRKLDPQSHFAGPDVDPFDPAWVSSFAAAEHSNVRLLDAHYYSDGPASNPAITYNDILAPNPKLDGFLVEMGKIAAQYKLPYRISECNSIWGGGKPGVSDTFASSLWALDFMWDVAENKGQGVNFHSGPPRFVYSPISMANGVVTARPEYYAMLAFNYATAGSKIIPATIVDPRIGNNCTAYACVNANGTYSITIINKDVAKSYAFTINLTNKASTIKVARLAAPSVTSTTGTTFSGSSVNADGTFTPTDPKIHTVNGKSFVVNVLAVSAVVVTVTN